jgi:3-hydroxyacyl-CoA dehydrogenase/enoyl-CoA hydratase/carnithine racemase
MLEKNPITIVRETRKTAKGNYAIITLTSSEPGKPATLGPIGLERLGKALDLIESEAGNGSISGLIVTGEGKTFCAGADLDMLSSSREVTETIQVAKVGHRVLGRLGRLAVPSIAAINGVSLGGGFEVALHCTHRIASNGNFPIGLPEVGLGLIPGWGGATLLPRLVGMESALQVMVHNAIAFKNLNPISALAMGAIDVISKNDLLEDAIAFIESAKSGSHKSVSKLLPTDTSSIEKIISKYSLRAGNPIEALEHLSKILLSLDASRIQESFEMEDEALSQLMCTGEFRRRLYSFRVISGGSRKPKSLAESEFNPKNIGVVGAGLMASQIALLLATKTNSKVIVNDVEQAKLDESASRIESWLSERVSRGELLEDETYEIRQRIIFTLDVSDFAACEIVIEAVFEDFEVKTAVFRKLEQAVSDSTILATNTSSLSVTKISDVLKRQDRVAGIHFFNPVAAMKLVEIIRGANESESVLDSTRSLAYDLGKTPVTVADKPGFVVNRLLSVFIGEALRLTTDGVKPETISEALTPLRLPMSPFELIDLIGLRVTVSMIDSMIEYAPDRFFLSDQMRELSKTQINSAISDQLIEPKTGQNRATKPEILERITDALAREVSIMMREQVVSKLSDIDLCMMIGAGWPAAMGGITPLLDWSGASERMLGENFHQEKLVD